MKTIYGKIAVDVLRLIFLSILISNLACNACPCECAGYLPSSIKRMISSKVNDVIYFKKKGGSILHQKDTNTGLNQLGSANASFS